MKNSSVLLLEALQCGGLGYFCPQTLDVAQSEVAAEQVNRLLSNPDGRIESVLVKPADGIGFQGVAGIGRKDKIQKGLEKLEA